MAIYVDKTWHHGRTPNMPYPESCHMMADTKAELLEFAQRLGLRPQWLHKDHFDIVPSKRALAIKMGALPMPGDGPDEDVHDKVRFLRHIQEQWQEEASHAK
jgi:hypothetical protein